MPTTTQLAMAGLNQARFEALFASGLQPSDAPTSDMVAAAITRTVRQFGTGGCAGRMAQEFGDHPDAAASRMRWVRQLVQAAARPQARLGTEPAGLGTEPAGLGTEPAGLGAGPAGPGTRLDGRDAAKGPVAA